MHTKKLTKESTEICYFTEVDEEWITLLPPPPRPHTITWALRIVAITTTSRVNTHQQEHFDSKEPQRPALDGDNNTKCFSKQTREWLTHANQKQKAYQRVDGDTLLHRGRWGMTNSVVHCGCCPSSRLHIQPQENFELIAIAITKPLLYSMSGVTTFTFVA